MRGGRLEWQAFVMALGASAATSQSCFSATYQSYCALQAWVEAIKGVRGGRLEWPVLVTALGASACPVQARAELAHFIRLLASSVRPALPHASLSSVRIAYLLALLARPQIPFLTPAAAVRGEQDAIMTLLCLGSHCLKLVRACQLPVQRLVAAH